MHGRFPILNKYYIQHEIFPLLSKEEKKNVYFPSKEQRSKRVTKDDLRLNKEDEEVLNKYRAK
jgi:hypothetical protein